MCGGGIFGEKEKEKRNIEEKGVDGKNGKGKKNKLDDIPDLGKSKTLKILENWTDPERSRKILKNN